MHSKVVKMKICCVLLSFAFANVFAVNMADYIKEVLITNKLIELAGEFMQPENLNNPEDSDYSEDFENALQNIIKNIICGDASMEKIAFMLVVPERADTRHLPQCIKYQTDMQKEIANAVALPMPDVENKTPLPVPDIENQIPLNPEGKVMSHSDFHNLSDLGIERRTLTEKAIRALLEYAIHNKDSVFSPFCCYSMMCRLTGLVESIENPSLYIIKAEYRKEDQNCWLTAVDKSVKSYTSDWDDI